MERTHMVNNRIADYHVAICFQNAAYLTNKQEERYER